MSNVSTTAEQWRPLFDAFTRLRTTWPARGWSWDSRLNSVTSSFNMEFEDKARACVVDALPLEWTPATLSTAPPRLRAVAEKSGGLRTGQLLVSAGPHGGLLAYGLWWPWRDGDTISLRIGLADVEPSTQASVRLRDVFGVTL